MVVSIIFLIGGLYVGYDEFFRHGDEIFNTLGLALLGVVPLLLLNSGINKIRQGGEVIEVGSGPNRSGVVKVLFGLFTIFYISAAIFLVYATFESDGWGALAAMMYLGILSILYALAVAGYIAYKKNVLSFKWQFWVLLLLFVVGPQVYMTIHEYVSSEYRYNLQSSIGRAAAEIELGTNIAKFESNKAFQKYERKYNSGSKYYSPLNNDLERYLKYLTDPDDYYGSYNFKISYALVQLKRCEPDIAGSILINGQWGEDVLLIYANDVLVYKHVLGQDKIEFIEPFSETSTGLAICDVQFDSDPSFFDDRNQLIRNWSN